MKRTLAFVLLVMLPAGTALAAVERLLIPINYNGPGAFGSKWKTLVAIDNRGTFDIVAKGHTFDTCGPNASCADARIPANSYATLASEAPHGVILTQGTLFGTGRVYGSVHIAAEPADPRTAGTEIPIARESDFVSTFVLPDVPTGPSGNQSASTRSLLRLYALEQYDLGEAYVSVYSNTTLRTYLGGATVRLSRPSISGPEPMYADLDLSRFAPLGKFVTIVVDGGARIPVIFKDTIKVWGFVTVTDNATNDVITITPRQDPTASKTARRGLLIPLNFNGPGAFGAKWHTTAVINNLSNYDLFPQKGILFDTCGPVISCTDLRVPEGSSGVLATEAPHGVVLYSYPFLPAYDGDIYASVHIAAEPNDPRTAGTEIPVARDADFARTFAITNASTGPLGGRPTRSLLRIYSIGDYDDGNAFVSVYSQSSPPELLGIAEVKMTRTSNSLEPLYGEIDLARFTASGQFVNLVIDGGKATFRVVPQDPPQTADIKVWGFVTITDNASNDVITITAH